MINQLLLFMKYTNIIGFSSTQKMVLIFAEFIIISPMFCPFLFLVSICRLTWSITPLPVFSVLWQLLLLLVFETLIPVQAICYSHVTAWQGSRVNWGNTALTELLLTVVVTIYAEVSLWNPRSWRRGTRWCKLAAHQRETPAPEAGVGAQEADETLAHLASLTKQPLPLWCRRRRQDNHTPLPVCS